MSEDNSFHVKLNEDKNNVIKPLVNSRIILSNQEYSCPCPFVICPYDLSLVKIPRWTSQFRQLFSPLSSSAPDGTAKTEQTGDGRAPGPSREGRVAGGASVSQIV